MSRHGTKMGDISTVLSEVASGPGTYLAMKHNVAKSTIVVIFYHFENKFK